MPSFRCRSGFAPSSPRGRRCPRSIAILAVAGLATATTAQEDWDNGPLIGAPFACLVNDTTRSLDPKLLYSKKAGFVAPGARTTPPGGRPDFRFGRIFRDRGDPKGRVPEGLRIDALSTGLDVIHIDPSTGILTPPANTSLNGILLTFVPEPPMARTASGILRREDDKPDRAGTDVFDFVYGSTAFPVGLYREVDGVELGLSDGTTASARGVITALDLPLTAWDLDTGIVGQLPRNPRIFFSVSPAAVPSVPDAWWGPINRNPATILYTEWDTTAPGDWSEPRVFATRSEMGLGVGDDVDALAVQWSGAGNTMIVFSTQPLAGRNQLLFRYLPFADGDPEPVRTTSGAVTDAANAGSANVASVCFWDPGLNGQVPCSPMLWSYVLGWPDGNLVVPGFPRLLESSVVRDCPSGVPSISCMATGWTAAGRPTPADVGAAVHMFTVSASPSTLPPALSGFPPSNLAFLRPMSSFGGDPMKSSLPLPPHLWAPDPARCFNFVWSFWVGVLVQPASIEFAQSRPVRIRL